ncbi:MAG TPA: 2-amino-4-hydroxy-6-hydroxymethyldihydropteridine diphosphokinase [Tepidiformaceae bacterium]
MTTAMIALGSNLGDRAGNLRAALRLMEERGVAVERTSSVWETAPVPEDQPAYLNAVARIETSLGPSELLATLKEIEHELGRRPGRRWGPRPIDLDILFYGEERVATPELEVPHPSIAKRAFVLAPLAEVVSNALPVLGKTAVELLKGVDQAGVERTGISLRG